MERVSSALEGNLPDFEATAQSGLEQIRDMQRKVEELITEINTLLAAEQYSDESLPALLSQARMLIDYSLPNTVGQYQQSELRLAGQEFKRSQKVWLFILGVTRGGSPLELFTKGIKNESTRKQVVEAVYSFNLATDKLSVFLSKLEYAYEKADKRSEAQKAEDAEKDQEEALAAQLTLNSQKNKERMIRITNLRYLIATINAEIKAESQGAHYIFELPPIIGKELRRRKETPTKGQVYQNSLAGLLAAAQSELAQLNSIETADPLKENN